MAVEEDYTSSGGLLASDLTNLIGLLNGCLVGPPSPGQGGVETVDLVFMQLHVSIGNARLAGPRLLDILEHRWPEMSWGSPACVLAGGPSYIGIGAVVEDQGRAMQLMAVGKVLGWWDIITPMTMGLREDEALAYAGRGLLMISGFRP